MSADADCLPGPDAPASFLAARLSAWRPRLGPILAAGLRGIPFAEIPSFPRTFVAAAAGIAREALSHDRALAVAAETSETLERPLVAFPGTQSSEPAPAP